MASIKYVGPFEAVDVAGLGTVEKGAPTDCPDELASSLLEQTDNWQSVTVATAKKKES